MAIFKPYSGSSDKLDNLPIKNGQFIITTDDGKLYFDADKKRIEVNKISNATTTSDGLMSAEDKIKLDEMNNADGRIDFSIDSSKTYKTDSCSLLLCPGNVLNPETFITLRDSIENSKILNVHFSNPEQYESDSLKDIIFNNYWLSDETNLAELGLDFDLKIKAAAGYRSTSICSEQFQIIYTLEKNNEIGKSILFSMFGSKLEDSSEEDFFYDDYFFMIATIPKDEALQYTHNRNKFLKEDGTWSETSLINTAKTICQGDSSSNYRLRLDSPLSSEILDIEIDGNMKTSSKTPTIDSPASITTVTGFKQYYNPKNIITRGYYYADNGTITSISNTQYCLVKEYIKIEPETTYTITYPVPDKSNTYAMLNEIRVCEYDKDKTFIELSKKTSTYKYTFTTTENTKYIRVSYWASVDTILQGYTLQIVKSSYQLWIPRSKWFLFLNSNKINMSVPQYFGNSTFFNGYVDSYFDDDNTLDNHYVSTFVKEVKEGDTFTIKYDPVTSLSLKVEVGIYSTNVAQTGTATDKEYLYNEDDLNLKTITASQDGYLYLTCLNEDDTLDTSDINSEDFEIYDGSSIPLQDYFELAKIGNVYDTYINGTLTKKIGKVILTGEETIEKADDDSIYTIYPDDFDPMEYTVSGICNYFTFSEKNVSENNQFTIINSNGSKYIQFYTDTITNKEDFSTFLKEKYESGNPVVIYYTSSNWKTYDLEHDSIVLSNKTSSLTIYEENYLGTYTINYLADSSLTQRLVFQDQLEEEDNTLRELIAENRTIAQEGDNTLDAKIDEVSNKIITLNQVYPVGSIYMSVNSTSPASLFGGTWEQLQNRFLLGAGSSYSNGSTGGSATHTLSESEMPSHNHRLYMYDSASEATGYSLYKGNTGFYNRAIVTASYGNYTQYTGGSGAHNNMPPYLVVYMWKRTA